MKREKVELIIKRLVRIKRLYKIEYYLLFGFILFLSLGVS
jgi:hypothetical protein